MSAAPWSSRPCPLRPGYLRALDRTLEDGDDLTVLTESRWLLRRLKAAGTEPDPLALRELRVIVGRAWQRAALALTPELRSDMAEHLDIDVLLQQDPSVPDEINALRR